MKTLVQFDGSNFYHKVKWMFPQAHTTYFDYVGLSSFISKINDPKIIYYVGEIRQYPGNKQSERLYASQQKVFTQLRNKNIEIKLGYFLMKPKKDGKGMDFDEKGVDVQIAVDIVRGAIKDEYDKFYLMSSDTDLLPAIKTAIEEGKEVIYVGFENFISRGLAKNCSSYIVLKKNDLQQFLNNP